LDLFPMVLADCAMARLPSCTLACTLFAGIALFLQGCGGGGTVTTPAPGVPTPPPPPPPSGPCKAIANCNQCKDGKSCTECNEGFQEMGPAGATKCMYACTSKLNFPVVAAEKKGLCLDDTTHHWCPDKVHSQWANTKNEMVGTIRINKAWESDWDMSLKVKAWDSIAAYLHASGAKALVGTSLSCIKTDDDNDWKDVLVLLKKIGGANVMGVAVGNELELLKDKPEGVKGPFPTIAACCVDMWNVGGYLETAMIKRIADLDALGGEWNHVKVTSVMGAAILDGHPFVDSQVQRVNTFFKTILKKFGQRYAFSYNVYPYFDSGNHFDPGAKTCKAAIARSTCFDKLTCLMPLTIADGRNRMIAFDNENPGLDMKDLTFWVTETGWSSPTAATLVGANKEMYACAEYSSDEIMAQYYKNFLAWDMTVKGVKGPDLAFWFTMRDSLNFGILEHFGLGGSGDPQLLCQNTTCKLQYGHVASETTVV